MKQENGAGGWKRKKKPGLVYRVVFRTMETGVSAARSPFAKLAFHQQNNVRCSKTLVLWGLTFSAFQWHCLTTNEEPL